MKFQEKGQQCHPFLVVFYFVCFVFYYCVSFLESLMHVVIRKHGRLHFTATVARLEPTFADLLLVRYWAITLSQCIIEEKTLCTS
jgi:hypothetical protein